MNLYPYVLLYNRDKTEFAIASPYYGTCHQCWQCFYIGLLSKEAIEKENESLKGVLTKNYARKELDKTRLGELVTLFTNIDVGTSAAQEKDIVELKAKIEQSEKEKQFAVMQERNNAMQQIKEKDSEINKLRSDAKIEKKEAELSEKS